MNNLEYHTQDECKLFFSGEEDLKYSEQTEFERASNYLNVGVLAHNRTVALALLHLVRIIIDESPDLLYHNVRLLVKETEDDYVNINEVLELFAENEEEYSLSFTSIEKLALEVHVGKKRKYIDRKIEEVDIWTLPRVMDTAKNLYCY